MQEITVPVWLRNQFISVKLEPVISLIKKIYIVSYCRQLPTNRKIKIIKSMPVFFNHDGPIGLIPMVFHFNLPLAAP